MRSLLCAIARARVRVGLLLHNHTISTASPISNTHLSVLRIDPLHFTITGRRSFATEPPSEANEQQVKFESLHNFALFREHGFSETDIMKLARLNPSLFNYNAEKILLPKLYFFRSMGLSRADLAALLASHPSLLTKSLEKHLVPCFNFFKNVDDSDDKKVLRAFKRLPQRFVFNLFDNMVPNVALLRVIEVPQSIITLLVSTYPLLASVKHARFVKAVENALEMGFDPSLPQFVQVLRGLSDSKWECKYEFFGRWGLSEEQMVSAFRKYPRVMVYSDSKVAKVMDFLVKEMGWPAEMISDRPSILTHSLEKTIVPRCHVIRALQLKGLVKQDIAFSAFLCKGDEFFLVNFVKRFQKHVPQLMSLYKGEVDLQDMEIEFLKSTCVKSSPSEASVLSYLVNSCGLPPDSAHSISRKVKFQSLDNFDSVLTVLKNHGFSETDISTLIRSNPSLLNYNAQDVLLPKLAFFRSVGLSGADLVTLLSKHPSLLTTSLKKHLVPCYNFFKNVAEFDDKQILLAFKRLPRGFAFNVMDNVVPNIALLREIGVPQSNITLMVTTFPLLGSFKHTRFLKVVEDALEMGLDPSLWLFIRALSVLSDTKWHSKTELLKRWGWSKKHVVSALRKNPEALLFSDCRLTSVMEFLVKQMGWPVESISHRPVILIHSLEKTIVPRCRVIRVLQLKGLVKQDLGFGSFLRKGDQFFLEKYVTRFQKHVPQLLSLYKGEVDLRDMGIESA